MNSEEEDFAYTLRSIAWELVPPFDPLRWRRGLNLLSQYPDRPHGWLNFNSQRLWPIVSINQQASLFAKNNIMTILIQNVNNTMAGYPQCRGYCYAELAVFFSNP